MHMKKYIAVIAVAAGLLLSGCGAKDTASQQPTDTALVLGIHANEQVPSTKDIAPYLEDTCASGTLYAVRVDGQPQAADEQSFDKISAIGKKDAVLEERVSEAIQTAAKECQPQADGSNPLEAINIAADCLNNNGSENKKKLVMYDTMLSDQEILNLCVLSQLSDMDITSTVNALSESHQLPQLDGVEVVCILAPTAAPQAELSQDDWEVVKQLYEAIFRAGGATDIQFVEARNSIDEPIQSTYSVTPVAVTAASGNIRIVLNSDAVAFRDNSAELLDEEAAHTSIQAAADQLIASGTHVLVCGSTASGDQEKALQLSGKRAAVITSELISCGVPAEQIDKTIGFGHGGPYVHNDLDDSGNQVEALAKSNRTVVIESATSETGRKILSGKWEYIS